MGRPQLTFTLKYLTRLLILMILPFVSWGPVPWITGVLSFLVALLFLLDIKGTRANEGIGIRFTTLWIPYVSVFGLAMIHLFLSPVPYRSLLFVTHFCVAGVLYLLLLDEQVIDIRIPVFVWTSTLIVWMAVQKSFLAFSPPAGPFSNPNYLATVLLTCLAWFVGQLVPSGQSTGQDKRYRFIALVAALVTTVAIAFIGSRSAGLAILFLWGVCGIASRGKLRLAAVAVVVLILLAPSTLKHRVTQEYRQDPHAFSRILIWEGALNMGMENAVIGVGPNLYYEHAPQYAFPTETLPVRYGRIARKPHNEYLRAWAEGGIVGTLAILGFLIILSRYSLAAWRQGKAGPVLAVAVFLFQAVFHDINEVFALTALGAFWFAEISRDEVRTLEIRGKMAKGMLTLAGGVILLLAIWLNMDASARVLWMKGQQLQIAGGEDTVETLSRAHGLNPLLPGVARDFAGASLAEYRITGAPREFEIAKATIQKAHRLNRLDAVPVRMEAALLVEQALKQPEKSLVLLLAAREKLLEAYELEPYNALIMLRIGEVSRDIGELETALKYIENALETEPNYLEAHRVRISILEELSLDSVDQARRDLDLAHVKLDNYRPVSVYEKIITR